MEKLQMKIRPEITIVPIKSIKKETLDEDPVDSEEDEDEEEDECDVWCDGDPMGVDPPALEPLVKIEEADEGPMQCLSESESPSVEELRWRQQQLIQQQLLLRDQQMREEELQKHLCKKQQQQPVLQNPKDTLQEYELRDRLEWKALANGKACTECGREFTALGRLRQHILTHLAKSVAAKVAPSVPVVSSPVATVPVVTVSQFQKRPPLPPHVKARRRHHCPTCGKTFIREAHLKRHVLVHTGERPHRCEVCHKCFTAADDLKVHTRVHTGERPHQCPMCSKAFTTAGNLKVHLRVHSGERPYGCNTCGKCFTRAAALKKHQRLHTTTEIPC